MVRTSRLKRLKIKNDYFLNRTDKIILNVFYRNPNRTFEILDIKQGQDRIKDHYIINKSLMKLVKYKFIENMPRYNFFEVNVGIYKEQPFKRKYFKLRKSSKLHVF